MPSTALRTGLALALAACVARAAPAPAAPTAPPGPRPRLAVADFTNGPGVDDDVSNTAANLVTGQFARDGRLDLLTRVELGAMLAPEQLKALAGCRDDAACLAKAAGPLHVDYLLTGEVDRAGPHYHLRLLVTDVRRARVVARQTPADVHGEDALEDKAVACVAHLLTALFAPGARAEPAAAAPSVAVPPVSLLPADTHAEPPRAEPPPPEPPSAPKPAPAAAVVPAVAPPPEPAAPEPEPRAETVVPLIVRTNTTGDTWKVRVSSQAGTQHCAGDVTAALPCRLQLAPGPVELAATGPVAVTQPFTVGAYGTRVTFDRSGWSGLQQVGALASAVGFATALVAAALGVMAPDGSSAATASLAVFGVGFVVGGASLGVALAATGDPAVKIDALPQDGLHRAAASP
jgi:hypothetical protein